MGQCAWATLLACISNTYRNPIIPILSGQKYQEDKGRNKATTHPKVSLFHPRAKEKSKEMNTLVLKSQFCLSRHTNLINPSLIPSFLIPTRTTSKLKKHTTKTTILPRKPTKKPSFTEKSPFLEILPTSRNSISSKEDLPNEYSRNLILGAVTVGFLVFVMGIDEQSRALAWGPEGPLMEEFWDNMRRYGLYVLTVSTGVLYAVFEPIVELLKNPVSAILILTIIGGGVFIVSQVVSAMVGVSEFNYDYSY